LPPLVRATLRADAFEALARRMVGGRRVAHMAEKARLRPAWKRGQQAFAEQPNVIYADPRCAQPEEGNGSDRRANTLAAAWLSSQRLQAGRERLLSNAIGPGDRLGVGSAARLGLVLPRVALDPCGGDGALRSSLAAFGIDVRLTDLYPKMYAAADGNVTR
jgi:hypothetical protein